MTIRLPNATVVDINPTTQPRDPTWTATIAVEGDRESIGSCETAVEPTADSERVMSRLLGLQLAHAILGMEDDLLDELLGNLKINR